MSKEPIEYPLGIKYWAQHSPNSVPKIEVYRCIGNSRFHSELFLFQSIRGEGIMTKEWKDLNVNGFKPFMIPVELIRKTYRSDEDA